MLRERSRRRADSDAVEAVCLRGCFSRCAGALVAQQVGNLDAPTAKPKSYVVYAAEQQNVAAGKRSVLELHFRVVDGFM